jgi:hypothetical protein
MKRFKPLNALGLLPFSQERTDALAAKKKPKTGTNTNQLTADIIRLIEKSGGYAERINTVGIYDHTLQKHRKGTTRRGTADIHACIEGRFYSIEVKTGADRLSEEQKQARAEVQRAGGVYLVANDLTTFKIWLDSVKINHHGE